MSTFIFLIHLYIICSLIWESKSNTGGSETLDKIAQHLGNTSKSGNDVMFGFGNIKRLFSELDFRNCTESQDYSTCNLCISPEEVMNWYKFQLDKPMDSKQFHELSVGIFYILSKPVHQTGTENNRTRCNSYKQNLLAKKTSDLYQGFLKNYKSDGNLLTETGLVNMLDHVNISIGHILTGKAECFNTHNVIQGTKSPDANFGYNRLKIFIIFIFMKFLDKTCFAHEAFHVHHHTINKDFFIAKLFGDLGNTTHITATAFGTFYEELFKGQSPSSHHHDSTNPSDGHGHNHVTKCYPPNELLQIFSVPNDTLIDREKFEEMSPALIELIKSGACSKKEEHKKRIQNTTWEPWIASAISIAIISFGSLIGIIAFRSKRRSYFPYMLIFMVSLGLSVLISDAMLHLFPHSLGLHGHGGSHEHHGEEDSLKADSYLWKCLLLLIGVYLFFLFELIMTVCGGGLQHNHDVMGLSVIHGDVGVVANNNAPVSPNDAVVVKDVHQNDGPPLPKEKFTMKEIKSVAWMILIGDGVHNFMDGVAIGAAFSEPFPIGLRGGIMTSIAIIIHEVPHELGDFAVLISSGLSIKQALVLNLLSSLTAFIGGIVGILLGTNWNASPWIFAVTGGLFLYISLVDMLPEVKQSPLLKTSPKAAISLSIFGMTLGLVVLFLIAAYEDDLLTALN